MQEKSLSRSRIMYILEAAIEYFIAILVASSFLATLTKELGFSDSLTGILSSVISLGCLFQLLSLSLRPKKAKKLVIALSIVNQVLFMLLYVIPVINISSTIKTVLFVVFIFMAYLIYNFAHPKKINWLMSLVDDNKRGSFTANKEIVSLSSGIVFSFAMGALIDYFSEIGKIKTAFVLTAVVIFGLMVLHTLAITQAIAGFTGFITTLLISPVVSHIQNSGNKVIGMPIFAQQFISVIALAVTISAIFYIRFVFIKKSSN